MSVSSDTTYTFTSRCGIFTCTVKAKFLELVANPEKEDYFELLKNHNMHQYLHNPNGPALVSHVAGHSEYFIDAKRVDPDTAKKIQHSADANSEIDKIINE